MVTVSRALANYALDLKYEQLPANVVYTAKRLVLDTLGCAIGGYTSDSSRIVQSLVGESGGPPESTVIGSGLRTSCANATLANGVMVRYLDYMDAYRPWRQKVYRPQASHPCDGVIPPALAVGEKVKANGKQVITSIVLGYEVLLRLCDAINLMSKGWHYSTFNAFSSPIVSGRLLGLDSQQIVDAIGISGCRCGALNVLAATGVRFYMARNVAPGWASQNGVFAALLAQKGLTGPEEIFEGTEGFLDAFTGGNYDLQKILKGDKDYRILEDNMKFYAVNYSLQTLLDATLGLVRQHNITAKDVDSILIKTWKRNAEHSGDPVKRFPEDKETADHSIYYVTAIAIIDGEMGPEQFAPEKLASEEVHNLIERITVEGDSELDMVFPEKTPTAVIIRTKQGKEYTNRVDLHRGAFQNPMTDEELKGKVRVLASGLMKESQVNKVIETVYHLEELDDVGKLMKLMAF